MRLIDADALMRRLCVQCDIESHEATCDPDECFVYNVIVYDAPTIEAEPVRHGTWEEEDERSAYKDFFVSCSKCGALLDKNKALHFKYCYKCGAKMDGGVSDD